MPERDMQMTAVVCLTLADRVSSLLKSLSTVIHTLDQAASREYEGICRMLANQKLFQLNSRPPMVERTM